jgi:hypothetical protein
VVAPEVRHAPALIQQRHKQDDLISTRIRMPVPTSVPRPFPWGCGARRLPSAALRHGHVSLTAAGDKEGKGDTADREDTADNWSREGTEDKGGTGDKGGTVGTAEVPVARVSEG